MAKTLTNSSENKKAFYRLSPYQQREYAEYITNAKTRENQTFQNG
ncbi:YdeI/OmpD-associated family protein [Maribacter aquimaris]|nr:YdeI/OmpD-associated family protein [Maribacter aquimaris]